jgi:hypothetical protein
MLYLHIEDRNWITVKLPQDSIGKTCEDTSLVNKSIAWEVGARIEHEIASH